MLIFCTGGSKAIPHNSRLTAQAPLRRLRHGICVAKMLDNVGLRYPHRASGAKAPRTVRPLPLLRFAVSATGGAHLCSIQYYLRFWLSICRTSLAVSALRIMRYCPMFSRAGQGRYGGILIRPFNIIRHKCGKIKNNRWSKQVKCVELRKIMSMAAPCPCTQCAGWV